MYEGGYGDFSINSDVPSIINNPFIERKKRVAMAYLLATYPESYDSLSIGKVNLFHGTKASALPTILKYGINSIDEANKNGIDIATGEEWSRIGENRSFISFSDDLAVAEEYASLTTDATKENSFGVVLGISQQCLKDLRTCTVNSYIPEIGIIGKVDIKNIKIIAVPENKIDFVKKLVEGTDIEVIPIDLNDKPFYIDDNGLMEIYGSQKNNQNPTSTHEKQKVFDAEEIKTVAESRKIRGIFRAFNYLKNKIKELMRGFERD